MPLWNEQVDADSYADGRDKYQAAVLDQYKLHVELADRVSARRGLANTFFLAINTTLVTALGLGAHFTPRVGAAVLVGLLGQCAAWFLTLRSYRQLGRLKWSVLDAMEDRLPARFVRAEWQGTGARRYLRLSLVEQAVPVLFAGVYVAAFVVLAFR